MASSVISSSPFVCKSSSKISIHRCRKNSISRKIVSVMAPQKDWSPSTTGSVKTGMTMTEKILGRASEKSLVVPGDNIWVNVDVLMTHDVCGPGAFGIFKREFGEKAKDFQIDPESYEYGVLHTVVIKVCCNAAYCNKSCCLSNSQTPKKPLQNKIFRTLTTIKQRELQEVRRKNAALQMQQFVGEEKNDFLDYLRSLQPEKVAELSEPAAHEVKETIHSVVLSCQVQKLKTERPRLEKLR